MSQTFFRATCFLESSVRSFLSPPITITTRRGTSRTPCWRVCSPALSCFKTRRARAWFIKQSRPAVFSLPSHQLLGHPRFQSVMAVYLLLNNWGKHQRVSGQISVELTSSALLNNYLPRPTRPLLILFSVCFIEIIQCSFSDDNVQALQAQSSTKLSCS